MYFVIRSPHRPSGFRTDTAPSGEERLEAYLAEKERASAYEALRDELDKKQEEPGIAAVFCRDCRHRWIGKRIEFEGDVEFQDLSGRLLSHTYTALLSGDSVHGWTVDTLAVKPGRIFPPKH